MRINWDENSYFDITFYRVYKTEGKRYYDRQEILADFTNEDEANRYADEQNENGIDCDVVPILSDREYWDLHPAPPIEL